MSSVSAVGSFVARWGAVALLIASTCGVGCASTSRLYVKSTAQTNEGNTLYMMVRAADQVASPQNYQEMAAKLFTQEPDERVISTQPIFPGNTATVTIAEADKQDIIVYFFFSDPGKNWLLPLRRPLPAEVYIELGQRQIERVQVRRK